jgi:hypothetical protein
VIASIRVTSQEAMERSTVSGAAYQPLLGTDLLLGSRNVLSSAIFASRFERSESIDDILQILSARDTEDRVAYFPFRIQSSSASLAFPA